MTPLDWTAFELAGAFTREGRVFLSSLFHSILIFCILSVFWKSAWTRAHVTRGFPFSPVWSDYLCLRKQTLGPPWCPFLLLADYCLCCLSCPVCLLDRLKMETGRKAFPSQILEYTQKHTFPWIDATRSLEREHHYTDTLVIHMERVFTYRHTTFSPLKTEYSWVQIIMFRCDHDDHMGMDSKKKTKMNTNFKICRSIWNAHIIHFFFSTTSNG